MRSKIIVIALMLSTSPVNAKHVYPKLLEPVDNGQTFTLSEPYVYIEKGATFTLSKGTYTVRYQDSKALYLLGEGQCMEMRVVPPKNPSAAWSDAWSCGIFLPKNASKGAAFFMIRKTPVSDTNSQGPVVGAIIRAGYGSFDFPTSKHDDALLRAKLQSSTDSTDALNQPIPKS